MESKARVAMFQKGLAELSRLNAEFALMKAELIELHAENQYNQRRAA